jgi:hypothetical protein
MVAYPKTILCKDSKMSRKPYSLWNEMYAGQNRATFNHCVGAVMPWRSCRPCLAALFSIEFFNRLSECFCVGLWVGVFKIFRREGDFKK